MANRLFYTQLEAWKTLKIMILDWVFCFGIEFNSYCYSSKQDSIFQAFKNVINYLNFLGSSSYLKWPLSLQPQIAIYYYN